jgi:hypothetical protein
VSQTAEATLAYGPTLSCRCETNEAREAPEATKLVDHVFIEAMALAAPLDLRIAWIPRSWNLEADDLAGKLIDC